MATRVSRVATTAPEIMAMPSPWKIGSPTITAPPTTTAAAVSRMGRARTAPASTTASDSRRAAGPGQLDEVHQQDRVADDDPGERDHPDHRGGGEEGAAEPVGRKDPGQGERDRRHDDQRDQVGLEPGDHQQVDQHQHRGERDAEIAEHLVGDPPLAVPVEAHLLGELGGTRPGGRDPRRSPAGPPSPAWRRPATRAPAPRPPVT